MTLAATSNPRIDSITAAGSGSDGVAAAGAVALNSIRFLSIDVHIAGATVSAPLGVVTLTGTDDALILAIAGSGTGSSSIAGAAVIASNEIGGASRSVSTSVFISGGW